MKLCRRDPARRGAYLEAYRRGLKVLYSDERIMRTELISPVVEEIVDALLLEAGAEDYFNRLIYATAVALNATLLTEDDELATVGRELRLKPRG